MGNEEGKTVITFEVEVDPKFGVDLPAILRTIEVTLLEKYLRECGWNKSKAARLLNIERTCLHEKTKRLGLNNRPSEH